MQIEDALGQEWLHALVTIVVHDQYLPSAKIARLLRDVQKGLG